jgi:hypothetical protein
MFAPRGACVLCVQDAVSLADAGAVVEILAPLTASPAFAFIKSSRPSNKLDLSSDPILAHPLYDSRVLLRCDAAVASRAEGSPVASPRSIRDLLRLYYIAQRLAKLDDKLFVILGNVMMHKQSRRTVLAHMMSMLEVRAALANLGGSKPSPV